MSYDITISQASHILNCSIETIRRWEKKGLIKPKRNAQGYRLFKIQELEKIHNKKTSTNNVPYKILKSNKKYPYKVVELFSGAGGLALGLHNSGLSCDMLVENDKNAGKTISINKPEWPLVLEDIKKVNFKGKKADVIAGGFPCQSFSYAGKGLGLNDIRGTLFFEYARAISEIKPKIILVENVRGLERHEQGKTLNMMIKTLEDLGYYISYKVLKSQFLDVPQKRERLIIFGINKAFGSTIVFPKERDYFIDLESALDKVPNSEGQKYSEKKKKS